MGMAGSSGWMSLSLGNGPGNGPLIVLMALIAGALRADPSLAGQQPSAGDGRGAAGNAHQRCGGTWQVAGD